ncbi:NAD(P)/FAD-dependent oxidoreductase [Allostreptomyces psammosilenae]|uniref:Thioredoxin reductase n=1 Tax=Allostreptomyces psammosilenae TaxID=1892865 RepID=A0A852ZZ17_9ACTN|nr:NAD(P)/FAD-dependent oxidoreductase [Allostreptomyces psammosilenae]NYI07586.1 thioredoxin reductase [Allostreptomyces psammosilenae]
MTTARTAARTARPGERARTARPGGQARSGRYDVVVVGGGAAGLSAGLTLARARRSVLVIDSGEPRNAPAEGVHNYLGLDGVPPAELVAVGRAEVSGYGGEVVAGRVVSVERPEGGDFRVVLEDGSAVAARRLLVTTGLVDELPDVPGLAELWGRDVLHCPYCHGWEVRDQPIGVLATGPLAVHQALLWRQWSERVTLFLHDTVEPDDEQYERLAARGIAVVDGRVAGLETTSAGDAAGRLSGVRLAGGRVVPCRALVVATRGTARAGLLAGLGVETTERVMDGWVVGDHVVADPAGATSVPGVWVAGNAADLTAQVVVAAAGGLRAAGAINADLLAEDERLALAARRAPVAAGPSHGPSHGFSPEVEAEVCERVAGERRHGI